MPENQKKIVVDASVNPERHGAPDPAEYATDGADTRNAEANLASRSNIVRDS